jgi:hypothetical protein
MFEKWRSKEEKELDEKFGIERKPHLGCIISIIGSILVWSSVYWFYILLTSLVSILLGAAVLLLLPLMLLNLSVFRKVRG